VADSEAWYACGFHALPILVASQVSELCEERMGRARYESQTSEPHEGAEMEVSSEFCEELSDQTEVDEMEAELASDELYGAL
jgi:hypothetical protein